MLDQGGVKHTRGNMLLWVAVALLSMVGLGANVYKANTGAEFEWPSTIAELGILVAAGYFIYDYFRKKREKKEDAEK